MALYDILLRADASPIAELSSAKVVAMRDGPEAGMAIVEKIVSRDELWNYLDRIMLRLTCVVEIWPLLETDASGEESVPVPVQEPEAFGEKI
ncbi:hypothetical protein [Aureliella helgolandensis]|uniref:Uncharacterized protein n=1 Tax=Aureliella helgolandensis TaxID=2527968 RepID=A0A518GCQ1_9BACT|nr:hypothetical protein [Aureliella helgolandensis]QDV26376.1 hypothetical protein Q31a_47500 [Aureliella helgolandensis]